MSTTTVTFDSFTYYCEACHVTSDRFRSEAERDYFETQHRRLDRILSWH